MYVLCFSNYTKDKCCPHLRLPVWSRYQKVSVGQSSPPTWLQPAHHLSRQQTFKTHFFPLSVRRRPVEKTLWHVLSFQRQKSSISWAISSDRFLFHWLKAASLRWTRGSNRPQSPPVCHIGRKQGGTEPSGLSNVTLQHVKAWAPLLPHSQVLNQSDFMHASSSLPPPAQQNSSLWPTLDKMAFEAPHRLTAEKCCILVEDGRHWRSITARKLARAATSRSRRTHLLSYLE